MVGKLKQVKGVTITGMENLVVFSFINKIAIFNLEKREIVAEFKTPYNDYSGHIEYGKYVGIDAKIPCLIDLEKMEIIKKFNGQSITKKYLIEPKYKSKEYDVECDGVVIIDIFADKILCHITYSVSGYGISSLDEKHSVLCTFDISTFELVNWENAPRPSEWWRWNVYEYKRNDHRYDYLEYDESLTNDLMSVLDLKKEMNFRVMFYNKKYNVIFFQNGDCCYSYYIDDNGSAEIANKEGKDFLAKLGDDEQKYIRKNGLTTKVLEYLDPEVVLDGGYFWALDSIERKAKQYNMSFDDILSCDKITDEELILYTIGWLETEIGEGGIGQYFTNGDEQEFGCLIKALKIIGATQTVKVVQEGIKRKQKNVSDEDYFDLEEKLDEDYVGMAIDYIKKLKGFNAV